MFYRKNHHFVCSLKIQNTAMLPASEVMRRFTTVQAVKKPVKPLHRTSVTPPDWWLDTSADSRIINPMISCFYTSVRILETMRKHIRSLFYNFIIKSIQEK